MHSIILLAQSAPTTQSSAPPWFQVFSSPMTLIGLLLLFVLFTSSRSKKKDAKQRDDMLKQLKRGDRIQTIGGIEGTVMRADDKRVEVKVDESNNTKIWFTRSAIHRVVEDEKAEAAK